MNTKLLRKVRKEYKIIDYPNGYFVQGHPIYETHGCLVVLYCGSKMSVFDKFGDRFPLTCENSLIEAKMYILSHVRQRYYKNSRRYKGIKVWWNG